MAKALLRGEVVQMSGLVAGYQAEHGLPVVPTTLPPPADGRFDELTLAANVAVATVAPLMAYLLACDVAYSRSFAVKVGGAVVRHVTALYVSGLARPGQPGDAGRTTGARREGRVRVPTSSQASRLSRADYPVTRRWTGRPRVSYGQSGTGRLGIGDRG